MKLTNKKVFLIGGAGFIGSHFLDLLLKNDNQILLFDDFSSGKMENIEQHINDKRLKIINGDIRDYILLNNSMKGFEVVFNFATVCLRVSINDPFYVESVNSHGVLNVCEAAYRNDVERLIYISSSEAVGTAKTFPMNESHPCTPTTVYGATKLVGEAYTRAYFFTYGLPCIVLRPFNSYGPREHFLGKSAEVIPRFFIRAMNDLNLIIYGDGNQTRDFTYVTDTAKCIFESSQNDSLIGDIVNIAYGEQVSINELADIILNITKKTKLTKEYVLKEGRPGDVQSHFADITKLKNIVGTVPRISIIEGVKLYWNWLKKNKIDLKLYAEDAGKPNWV